MNEAAVPLTAVAARELTARIRHQLDGIHQLIIDAYHGQAWWPLGYDSWSAYVEAEFPILPKLSIIDRQTAVTEMRQAGMSTRAIGSALGMTHTTTQRDLSSIDAHGPSASGTNVPLDIESTPRITGVNGKTYPAATPQRPAPAERFRQAQEHPITIPEVLTLRRQIKDGVRRIGKLGAVNDDAADLITTFATELRTAADWLDTIATSGGFTDQAIFQLLNGEQQ